MGQDSGEIREAIEDTRGQMGDTLEAIGYKSDVKARAKDSVSEKVDSVKSKLTGVGGKAGELTPSGEEMRQGARRAGGVAKENPIGLALAGVATGFLLGMALPSTEVEDEKLGGVSTQVKDQAKETGQELLEHGKDIAQEALQSAQETVQESAQEHGEQLKEHTQERAEATREQVSG
jgi:hypothetical protein